MSLLGKSSTPTSSYIIIALILGAVFYVLKNNKSKDSPAAKLHQIEQKLEQNNIQPQDNTFLPTSTTGEIVAHSYYTLSYSEKDEQAEWVAYTLTRDMVSGFHNERNDNFRPDKSVPTGSATPDDYRGSGYDRGHLCPASDMNSDVKAMDETFFMSNMSPQLHFCNCGVWRELEESVKDWAKKYRKIYVITGPILKGGSTKKIGRANKVTVPNAYYKVIMTAEGEQKAVAFIVPNESSEERLDKFLVSVDRVEEATGIDFFPKLLTPAQESKLEATVDLTAWQFNDKRYNTRITKWNKK